LFFFGFEDIINILTRDHHMMSTIAILNSVNFLEKSRHREDLIKHKI